MVVLLPFAPFIIALAVGLFLYDSLYGLTFLLTGFALFNRNFAYTHVEIAHFPIYITEFCLIAWALSSILRTRTRIVTSFLSIPLGWRICWLGFLSVGLLSAIRGITQFPIIRVLRDSAIVYYSIAAFLLLTVDVTADRLKLMFKWVAGAVFLRSLLCLFIIYTRPEISEPLAIFYGQGAGGSLWIALTLLAALAYTGFWPSQGWMLPWMTVLLMELMGEAVRSSWTGFVAAVMILAILLTTQIKFRKLLFRVIAVSALMILLPGTLIHFLSSIQVHTLATAPVKIGHPKTIPSPRPVHTAPPPKTATNTLNNTLREMIRPKPLETHLEPDPTLTMNRRSVTPWQNIMSRFRSLGQGSESVNVNTRLLMWKDAITEVLGMGLYSPSLHRSDLQHFHLPSMNIAKLTDFMDIRPTIFTGLENEIVRIRFIEDGTAPKAPWFTPSRLVTILFGFPFGKLFLPPEIIFCVVSPYRYDPHNSFIAIFYRTGAVGFVLFAGMTLMVFHRMGRILKTRSLDSFWSGCLMATGAGIAYHLVHSLTDNTLENAFKGLVFWVLIGLALSIMHRAERTKKTDTNLGS